MSKLSYVYEFEPADLQGIRHCHDQHGFAIVKQILSHDVVMQLQDEVRRVLGPLFRDESVPSVTHGSFIENSPVLTKMMTFEPVMRIIRFLNDEEPLTLNRSAAIFKKPGAAADVPDSGAMAWHTDCSSLEHPYKANSVLNNTGASSCWFYLTGSRPQDGGLSIIPDSHTEDWPAPEGFSFTPDRRSFYRTGTAAKAYGGMDVPGMMPVITEPGDMVLFAERTYHGVHPHRGTEPRLSCAMSFRKKSYVLGQHWPLPESTKQFIQSAPQEVQDLVDGYIGIDHAWVSNPKVS